MLERGVVRTVRGAEAEVEIFPISEEACASCGTCGEGPEGRLLTVETAPGVEPGQRVTVEIREGGELGPAFVVLFLPVLALLIGVILGSEVPRWLDRPGLSPILTGTVGGTILLLAALLVVRAYDQRYGRRRPAARILRIED